MLSPESAGGGLRVCYVREYQYVEITDSPIDGHSEGVRPEKALHARFRETPKSLGDSGAEFDART